MNDRDTISIDDPTEPSPPTADAVTLVEWGRRDRAGLALLMVEYGLEVAA
jgi:hypothetical protein